MGLNDEPAFVRQLPHYEVGRRLAIAWKLPPSLVEVCASHHHPETARHDPVLLGIVIAADKFCESCGLVIGGAPRQLLPNNEGRSIEAIINTLPRLTDEQGWELNWILAQQFQQMLPALEFNSAGLLNAAVQTASTSSYCPVPEPVQEMAFSG
jgi:hypothetical protein